MERNGTPVAIGGAVALAALLLSPFGSNKPTAKQSSAGAKPAGISHPASRSRGQKAATSEALSHDDSGPWHALCHEFAGDEAGTNPAAPTEQLEEVERTVKDEKGEHKFEVHKVEADDLGVCSADFHSFAFLIATVPDPKASHLDIEFDRMLDSLQRAAAVQGYNFERYWLPWRPGHEQEAAGTSETEAHAEEHFREEQPGLLVFRRPSAKTSDPDQRQLSRSSAQPAQPDERLLIFLVGETPTAGLNQAAFSKSLHYIEQLSPASMPAGSEPAPVSPKLTKKRDISVAGPIFSASLPPLGDAIERYIQKFAPDDRPAFHVVSYGVRSDAMIDAFDAKLRATETGSTFSTLDLRISEARDDLIRYLHDLGYDDDEIAVLGEDGTPFGNSIQPTGNSGVLSLQFPRDLSSIRNATEGEGTGSEPQQIAGVNLPSIGVAVTLRQDDTNEHDTPPDFAQTQSSARVDRALLAMVKALRSRRIQAVLVTATNPLDRIFLLEYLHQTVPDVRLATVGADDFMLARPRSIDLSGTLAVTSLPLTENTVSVRDKPNTFSINFPSNASEGMFLAAANLLSSASGLSPYPHSIASIAKCSDISIVGKTGFRPAVMSGERTRVYPCFDTEIARINVVVGKPKGQTKPTKGRLAGGQTNQSPEAAALSKSPVPFLWVMALIGLLVGSSAHLGLACSSNGWFGMGFLPSVRRFAISLSDVGGTQLLFLLVATEQIFLLEWVAVTTTLALDTKILYQQALFGVHIVLLAASAFLCGWVLFQMTANGGHKHSRAIRASVVGSLLFVTFTALSWWFLLNKGGFELKPDLARLVALRNVYFLEGLSPLLPFFFVLLGYYLWSLNNLARLSMVVTRVSLAIPRDNPASAELAKMIDQIQASIRPNIDLKASTLTLLGLTIVGCCLVRLQSALRGFEYCSFRAWLLSWGFVLLLLIIVAMFHRGWDVWSQLRKVLHFLDSALLGRVFSHVPKDISSIKVWSSRGTRSSLMVQVRTAELLQRLDRKYPIEASQAVAAGAEATPISPGTGGDTARSTDDASLFSVLREVGSILDSGGVLERALTRKLSALLNRRMPQTGFLFDPEAVADSTLPQGEKNLLELYVAYRFIAFLRYVMAQLRNKLIFVIYGFACLVVAATSYPFQGRQALGTLLSLVFVLLLGGVAVMMIQMYRDPILQRLEEPSSKLADTFEVVAKLIGVAGVPLLAVLASQFPSLAEGLLNWLRPLVEASH